LSLADYDAIFALWQRTPGMGLHDADSRENLANFLARNPGLSFVAVCGGTIIGTILCGHDGRRGFLYHLAVRAEAQGYGVGRSLVERSLANLKAAGITKCHLFVMADNSRGLAFWDHIGFTQRADIHICSQDL
jgi:ribosomal protein S18 acetylase RimI-like enzyme